MWPGNTCSLLLISCWRQRLNVISIKAEPGFISAVNILRQFFISLFFLFFYSLSDRSTNYELISWLTCWFMSVFPPVDVFRSEPHHLHINDNWRKVWKCERLAQQRLWLQALRLPEELLRMLWGSHRNTHTHSSRCEEYHYQVIDTSTTTHLSIQMERLLIGQSQHRSGWYIGSYCT